MLEFRKLFVCEHRRFQFDQPRMFWSGFQQVPLRTNGGFGGHDDLFPDAIDRRIGDLGEELLEIIE